MGPNSHQFFETISWAWHRLPKVDIKKFNVSSPTGLVTQMEYYFYLHGITYYLMKLHVGVLYLDPKF
jgi:hypothetical protein